MPYRAHYRSLAVAMVFTLVVALALFIPNVSANDGDDVVVPPKPTMTYPNLSTHLNHLAEGYGSGRMSQSQAAGEAPVHSGGSVAVTVYLDGHVSDVVSFLEDNGGDPRNVGSDYIEAYVPVGLLGQLSQQTGVTRVSEIIPPQPAYGNVTSQAVALHLADSWQDAGYQGQGVKVGVIDVEFGGYSSLMGIELPNNVKVRCYTEVGVYSENLADCEAVSRVPASVPAQCRDYVARLNQDNGHGTAVAEAVIDIAPEATLYLAMPQSKGDVQEIERWMAQEGVLVINQSLGWIQEGPGDGTSPFDFSILKTVDQAVANGITWVNSAGNGARNTWFQGYRNANNNLLVDFSVSGDEFLDIPYVECRGFTIQLRWEDIWGGARTDLNIALYDKSAGKLLEVDGLNIGSVFPQSGDSNHIPLEVFSHRALTTRNDIAIVIIHRSGPEPEWIQLSRWGGWWLSVCHR